MGGDTPTVLVVEDDASLRLLCRVNLEVEGCRVLEAPTLGAARQLVANDSVEVVLLDVHLGQEDGLELLHELRRDRPSLPVALFTGSADIDSVSRLGADEVLRKPFSLEGLSETVKRLLDRRRG